jgi:hypothetical protein
MYVIKILKISLLLFAMLHIVVLMAIAVSCLLYVPQVLYEA